MPRTPTSVSTGVTARAQAVRFLARREYSAKELRERLLGAGFADEEIKSALETLQAKDMQSDARFAEVYCRSKIAKGIGPARIEYALRDHGIGRELIAELLAEQEPNWEQDILQLLNRRLRGADLRDAKERAKQIRFLYGRGYSDAQIRAAMKAYLA